MSICTFCRSAGNANSERDYVNAERLHLLCSDKTCFCQHGVGQKWVQRAAQA